MKSIKEKAEEHLRENDITQYEYKSYIEGAVFGANYVLEQITEAIRLCDNDRNTDLYKSLWDCIDRLRK